MQTPVFGVDFTSSPTRKKPVVLAQGTVSINQGTFTLQALHRFDTHARLLHFLEATPAWIAGFDMPFALPRMFLQALGWPHNTWHEHIAHLATLSRAELVNACRMFCAARPVGAKFAHRACDLPAGSSPSMKWINPPVALMLHAGAPLLLQCQASLPGMHAGHAERIALEAYPGFAARQVLGRQSYKSDDAKKQNSARQLARDTLIDALVSGAVLKPALPPLHITVEHKVVLLEDASGDSLDAVICALQAAWGAVHEAQGYGLPTKFDALEGWIVSVPQA
jgi:Protein of unknown function (DUF429)